MARKDDDNRKFARKQSLYALTPDQRWLHQSLAFPLLGITYLGINLICLVVDVGELATRIAFTVVAVVGLVYRVVYYARKEWMLYFIDLCFVNGIALVASLWLCTDGACSEEWTVALEMVGTGAVGGATFALQTPLTLHHPEAFESFFLHVSPMLIGYARRWRWGAHLEVPGLWALVSLTLRKAYVRWVFPYTIFLLVQPFLSETVAGWETLMDLQLFPGATREERLQGKRGRYASYAKKVLLCVVVHAVLSCSGFVAAAMAFRCWYVNALWIAVVQAYCILCGFYFYQQCAAPDFVAPGLMQGFKRMAVAWLLVIPTYLFACSALGP